MKARITVTLKNGVLDPQGRAIANALHSLGFGNVEDVRQGKLIEVQLKAAGEAEARTELDAMCRQLLANTVIENYRVEFVA
ncbi:MAG: phosphoribosylformylglycinamidine synthase subunit PurS [Rhodomicrobium sp.]